MDSIADAMQVVADKERKQRKRATVLVSVPGWPSQEPGRLMVWDIKSSIMKAKKEIKRLQEQMPDYEWTHEMLSYTQARAVRLKQFDARAMRRRNGAVPAA